MVVQVKHEERRQTGSVGEYLSGAKQVYDSHERINVVKIFSGEWYVTSEDVMLTTILGSCVSACIRDPVAKIGGMNHFLLPGDDTQDGQAGDAARYGVFAMENLLNGIYKGGGRKDRLEVKVFGGGNVINNSARIGSKNAQFIRMFLLKEGLHIASQDLEGDYPRRINYYPLTGKVMMRQLRRKDDMQVLEVESRYKRQIAEHPVEGNIELF